jgi:hypothetical protein
MLFPFNFLGSAFDPNAQAFISAAGITNPTQQNAINQLVINLKADGLWTKMKAVYPMVGGTAYSCKYNLVNPQDTDAAFRLVFNGGWTFDNNGATPNGTNGYADTKLIPSSVLSISSAHFSKYNRTNDLIGNKIDGSRGSSDILFFQQNYSAGNAIIGDVTSLATYIPTDTRGLFNVTRTATNSIKVFQNSTNIVSNVNSITGLPIYSIFIGARNDLNTAVFYNTYQTAFASIGDGLTDTDALNLYNRVQTFQISLSRQV